MFFKNNFFPILGLLFVMILSSCQNTSSSDSKGTVKAAADRQKNQQKDAKEAEDKIWDLFKRNIDENVTIAVNKYLWVATLEVLDFLPIEQADPFSGVIVFGYGTPPGSSQAYRASVLITDPALDLRSLNIALATQAGPVSEKTRNRIENAILTRARQLRLRDKNL